MGTYDVHKDHPRLTLDPIWKVRRVRDAMATVRGVKSTTRQANAPWVHQGTSLGLMNELRHDIPEKLKLSTQTVHLTKGIGMRGRGMLGSTEAKTRRFTPALGLALQ